MRVVLTGGGTGGHLFPLIAVAQELRKIAQENKIVKTEFYYVGAGVKDAKVFEAEEIRYKFITTGKLKRYASPGTIGEFFKIPFGIVQSFFILLAYYPDVIFSKGGYGAFPVVFAGWLLRIPILIHESDSVPGLANRMSARYAKRIAVSFKKTINMFSVKKTALVGNPVRLHLAGGSKESAAKKFGLKGGRPVILVLGGSQGSRAINDAIMKMLSRVLQKYEILHQCGSLHFDDVKNEAKSTLSREDQDYYHPFGFLNEDDLADVFAVCDIVVARAGSGTLFELGLIGKPAILIPLPGSASDHQRINAYEYAMGGAAVIIEQPNFVPGIVETKLDSILHNNDLYQRMASAAKEFAKPKAAYIIANELMKLSKFS